MSQQQQDLYFDYGGNPAANGNPQPTRSPNNSRPYLGNGGFQSGMSLPRAAQRPFDAPRAASGVYGDRMPSGYGQRGLEQQQQQPPHMGQQNMMPYMAEQPWGGYSPASVATVNGAMNGNSRQRGVNRRGPIPQGWADQSGMGMPYAGSPIPGAGSDMRFNHGQQQDMRGGQGEGEQLIPTAIVIKNIPFAVRRETLAGLMHEMNLPQPYAFNYHFDNGVFRGLAFANFANPEDTQIVIEQMNGLDVHGRKLRVEYKKMLPEAERERIEREKRERRGQLEEQHRAPILHQQPSISSLSAAGQNRGNTFSDLNLNDPDTLKHYTELMMFKSDANREILIFPSAIPPEHRREIHILAHHMGLEHSSTGDGESRQIHVFKRKIPSPTAQMHNITGVNLDLHKKGLSRAATFSDFAAGDREGRAVTGNYQHMMGRQNPTLEVPSSPEGAVPGIRAAKSFADLRSFSPSPSVASSSYLAAVNGGMSGMAPGSNGAGRYNEYATNMGQTSSLATPNLTPTTPGAASENSLLNSLNAMNLGQYDAPPQQRSTPGAIGSQRPGAGAGNRGANAPERQPRGPGASEWDNPAGFGGRGRTNGHAQRGSDSSDSGARIGPGGMRYH